MAVEGSLQFYFKVVTCNSMEEKKGFQNIKASIAIATEAELKRSVNEERVNDYRREFNNLYFELLNQLFPTVKWGIIFKQIEEHEPRFEVDIFTDQINDYALIHNTITHNPPKSIRLTIMAYYWGFDEFLRQSEQQFPE
jgi:hypothetical protein